LRGQMHTQKVQAIITHSPIQRRAAAQRQGHIRMKREEL
jgi:hypothetical protein